MYALIDCNNFFVSCERLFRPDLEGKPVVVLSSNDGCAISRSNEAKALGIPMGAPIFKYRELFERHSVTAFSANFELYGDISERISTLLTSITPHLENYSIDEAFLDLDQLDITNYATWGRQVRADILRDIGIPVSIGIAPTKTLCKAANLWAKKHAETGGIFILKPDSEPRKIATLPSDHTSAPDSGGSFALDSCLMTLGSIDVTDVWGVGWRLAPKLKAEGIFTALDLANMNPRRAQQLMGIHGRHMVHELCGTRCLPLQSRTKPQQMVSRGRQFGEDTSDEYVIEAAIASLAGRAAAELRREGQLTRYAAAIIRTNHKKPGYTRRLYAARLVAPTADTGLICSVLMKELRRDFNRNLRYHKADVVLYGLVAASTVQIDVFGDTNAPTLQREHARMHALDSVNAKHGPGMLRPAAELLSNRWQPRRNMLSPRYTSAWSDIPLVNAKQQFDA